MTIRQALICVMVILLVYSQSYAGEEPDRIVITRDEIERMNLRRITDVLDQLPGVKATDSSITVRGSSNVKVLLDGRPINDPISGGVEYGDDSSGGVIIITTRKVEAFHGNLEIYAGNLGTESYSLNCSTNKGPVGIGMSGGYEVTDGHRPNDDEEKWRAAGKLQYAVGRNVKLMLSADYSRGRGGLPGSENYPTPRSRKKAEMFSSVLSAAIKGVKSTTHFNRSETSNIDPDKSLDTSTRITKAGEEISIPISIEGWGKISFGGGFEWSRATGKQFSTQQENEYWIFAAKSFSSETLPLTLTTGVRSSFYSEFGEVVNPEIMARWDKEVYAVQCSWTRTNNTPSFRKRYNETSSTKPNPDLTMEKADNFNLSFIYQPNDKFLASVSPFYSQVTDRITYVRDEEGIGRYENFGKVTYKGMEFSFDWKVLSSFSLKAHYMYLEAKDENTGYWLPLKAKHRVGMDLICTPREDIAIMLNSKYVSRRYSRSNNTGAVSEYCVADFRCEYSLRGVAVFCEIKNMFDKYYFYSEGYPAAPRTWIVGVNYEF
ncbi:MAG: TonB-dependent receptor [Deltaproteobacteria bacterium]|nr:TonB-dependent receptor [Deltaproteobacteria bacterium]